MHDLGTFTRPDHSLAFNGVRIQIALLAAAAAVMAVFITVNALQDQARQYQIDRRT